MKRLFVESGSFKKFIDNQIHPDLLKKIQQELLKDRAMGDVIEGTGGVRKFRFVSVGRGTRAAIGYFTWTSPHLKGVIFCLFLVKQQKRTYLQKRKR